jgi:3'(2'), 5'-bisphosphate nucleotidase
VAYLTSATALGEGAGWAYQRHRMDDIALAQLALHLAAQASAEILSIRGAGFIVQSKADLTPVTLADTNAERIIVDGLRAATPHIPVIAEEEVAAGKITVPGTAYWLVDPLDGTRGFANGGDDFTVNIGLVRNGRAVIGAVACPVSQEIFYGIVGIGAWKQISESNLPIRVRQAPPEGLTVMASRHYQHDPKLAAFLASYKIAGLTNIGSAQKFLRIAEGKADFYPRLGATMEWDTAAPQAVLEAAGGSTRTFDGATLTYGKPSFENPPFLCHGAGTA